MQAPCDCSAHSQEAHPAWPVSPFQKRGVRSMGRQRQGEGGQLTGKAVMKVSRARQPSPGPFLLLPGTLWGLVELPVRLIKWMDGVAENR